MEVFGIGPLELFFILVIALIVLGPKDMAKAGRTLGRFMRKIVTSQEWRTVQKASREFKNLPNRLMREASLEELSKDMSDINKIGGQLNTEIKQVQSDFSSWTTPPQLANNEEMVQEPPSPASEDIPTDAETTDLPG
jgi:sec-independent protein translocase protein TatB